jgi:hypothetical protein
MSTQQIGLRRFRHELKTGERCRIVHRRLGEFALSLHQPFNRDLTRQVADAIAASPPRGVPARPVCAGLIDRIATSSGPG